jgi:multidrug efflux pump
VQTQNQVQQAISRLPAQVQQQGVRVTKSNPDFLLIVGLYDETDQRTNMDVSDYLASNIQDPLSRVPGVGDVNVFGAPHAMRIWLNPQRLAAFSLMPGDVVSAIRRRRARCSTRR